MSALRSAQVADALPRAKIEVFASLKYTALTGHRLPGAPAVVRDAEAALDALYAKFLPRWNAALDARLGAANGHAGDDEAVLDRARNASNGADFCRLFDAGDLSGHEGDHPQRGKEALLTMLTA